MASRDSDPGSASAPEVYAQLARNPAGSPGAGVAAFLRRVRRRLRRRALLRAMALWLAAALGSGTVLAAAAAATGPRALWLPLSLAWSVAAAISLGYGMWRLYVPGAGRPSDEDIARYVGARVPDLHSDLLSVVELCREQRVGRRRDATVTALVTELCRRTAAATATLEPRQLVDFGAAWRAGLLAAGVSLGVLLLARVTTLPLRQGLTNLFRLPPPNPVQVSSDPLLGDLRLLLTYPRYTGLPQRTIPGS